MHTPKSTLFSLYARMARWAAAGLILATSHASFAADANTMRIARGTLPPSLGVPFTAVGPPSSEIWSALFDGLTRIGPDGAVQPALALSWDNTSPNTWRFQLRPNVRFHDGAPFNAAAVVAVFDLLRKPESAKYYVSSEVRNIAGVQRVDDLTVEITTKEPDAILPRRLNMIYMISPTAWANLGEDGFAQMPSGTGPFKLADWGRATAITKLTADKTAWRKPKLDTLMLYTVPEAVRRVQSLLAGQVDIATRLGPDELRQLPDEGFTVATLPKSQVMAIVFRNVDHEKSPVSDVRVREALNLAIDRDALVQSVFEGRVTAASQGSASVTQGYNPNLQPIRFDPDRARKLLAEAGHGKGLKLRIDVFLGQLASDELIYQQVAQNIREVGVDVDLRAIPYAQWLRNYVTGTWGDTDAFSLAWDSGSTYDAMRPIEFSSCLKDKPFFCDQSIMPSVRDVSSEMDPAKRLSKLQNLASSVRSLWPAIWITTISETSVMRDGVAGFVPWHMGLQYENLSFEPSAK